MSFLCGKPVAHESVTGRAAMRIRGGYPSADSGGGWLNKIQRSIDHCANGFSTTERFAQDTEEILVTTKRQ